MLAVSVLYVTEVIYSSRKQRVRLRESGVVGGDVKMRSMLLRT
jgi:hypothetical protein